MAQAIIEEQQTKELYKEKVDEAFKALQEARAKEEKVQRAMLSFGEQEGQEGEDEDSVERIANKMQDAARKGKETAQAAYDDAVRAYKSSMSNQHNKVRVRREGEEERRGEEGEEEEDLT